MTGTKYQNIAARTSEILVLSIGAATNATREGVMCGINLFWWDIISSDLQGIKNNCSLDPPVNIQGYIYIVFSLLSTIA